jgi:N-terminal domain of oxidoreductase
VYQLVRRRVGLPLEADFEIVSVELGDPSPGEVLVRNVYFSVDPYHREEMAERGGWELHAHLEGQTIGQVIASGVDAVPIGELVVHRKAYSTHALVTDFRTIVMPAGVPTSAYLPGNPGRDRSDGLGGPNDDRRHTGGRVSASHCSRRRGWNGGRPYRQSPRGGKGRRGHGLGRQGWASPSRTL